MISRKIYLASSWRNANQPKAVEILRAAGHEVYDFRNPPAGSPGFAWSPIDPDWLSWTPERFGEELSNPIAQQGFKFDKDGLDWCDTCVLLLPCGKSAHLEAGYAIGQGKPTLIVLDQNKFEPELMYLLATEVVVDLDHMLEGLETMIGGELTPSPVCVMCGKKHRYLSPYCPDCQAIIEVIVSPWEKRVEKLEAELAAAEYLDAEASIGAKELMLELARAKAATIQWVVYDGTPSTRPESRCNEFSLGAVLYFTPLGGGTTMIAYMMPFRCCRFPSDIEQDDIPNDFGPDEIVWQRVDKPEVVWLASQGDQWAYLPVPPEVKK